MKKRILALGLLICLLCTACGSEDGEVSSTLRLYYKTAALSFAEEGLISYEEGSGTPDMLPNVLADRYFGGPQDPALVSPFPKGTKLLYYTFQNQCLYLKLSSEFSELTGVDRSLALSCICSTFMQLDGVAVVEIDVEHSLLQEQQPHRLTGDDILTVDNTQELVENKLRVYYADSEQRYLIAQEVKTKLSTVEEQAAYAVSLLVTAPEEDQLRTTLPLQTEILDLSIENGLCTIDFSADFYRNRPQTELGERMTLLSVVNTLTEFPEIESVQFFVEGQVLDAYYKMDLSLSYTRDESAIGPVRSGLNETDVSLYVTRDRDGALAEIPTRLRPAANETDADAVMNALLDFEAKNGFSCAVPADTRVLSLEKSGGYAYLDLSKEFAEGLRTEEEEKAAVQSVVRSLKSLDDISFVVITIEGAGQGLQSIDLNQVF